MNYVLPDVQTQATILGEYLLKQQPTRQMIGLFERAGGVGTNGLTDSELRTLAFIFRHPILLPYVDAYYALFAPNTIIRRRLYLMFSIMEASPTFASYFLTRKRSASYIFVLPFIGLRAIGKVCLGLLIVKGCRL